MRYLIAFTTALLAFHFSPGQAASPEDKLWLLKELDRLVQQYDALCDFSLLGSDDYSAEEAQAFSDLFIENGRHAVDLPLMDTTDSTALDLADLLPQDYAARVQTQYPEGIETNILRKLIDPESFGGPLVQIRVRKRLYASHADGHRVKLDEWYKVLIKVDHKEKTLVIVSVLAETDGAKALSEEFWPEKDTTLPPASQPQRQFLVQGGWGGLASRGGADWSSFQEQVVFQHGEAMVSQGRSISWRVGFEQKLNDKLGLGILLGMDWQNLSLSLSESKLLLPEQNGSPGPNYTRLIEGDNILEQVNWSSFSTELRLSYGLEKLNWKGIRPFMGTNLQLEVPLKGQIRTRGQYSYTGKFTDYPHDFFTPFPMEESQFTEAGLDFSSHNEVPETASEIQFQQKNLLLAAGLHLGVEMPLGKGKSLRLAWQSSIDLISRLPKQSGPTYLGLWGSLQDENGALRNPYESFFQHQSNFRTWQNSISIELIFSRLFQAKPQQP